MDFSISGGNGATTVVNVNATDNAAQVNSLESAISSLLSAGSAAATFVQPGQAPPPPPPGKIGVLVDTVGGAGLVLTNGYQIAVLAGNTPSAVLGISPDNAVLSGTGGLSYLGTGSNTVVAGGGANLINLSDTPQVDPLTGLYPGPRPTTNYVSTGSGDDTISTYGGNNVIAAGGGHNLITVGPPADPANPYDQYGGAAILSTGADTISASGFTAMFVNGSANTMGDTVSGSGASLMFIGGSGNNSVVAGGQAVLFGGSGINYLQGGTAAQFPTDGSGSTTMMVWGADGAPISNNVIHGGTGQSTLVGGGSGDQLYLEGAKPQTAIGGMGNETLDGGSSAGNDMFIAGSGNETLIGGSGADTFAFKSGFSGTSGATNFLDKPVSDIVQNFDPTRDTISLTGYGANGGVASIQNGASGSVVTLTDGTLITVAGVSDLPASAIIKI